MFRRQYDVLWCRKDKNVTVVKPFVSFLVLRRTVSVSVTNKSRMRTPCTNHTNIQRLHNHNQHQTPAQHRSEISRLPHAHKRGRINEMMMMIQQQTSVSSRGKKLFEHVCPTLTDPSAEASSHALLVRYYYIALKTATGIIHYNDELLSVLLPCTCDVQWILYCARRGVMVFQRVDWDSVCLIMTTIIGNVLPLFW